MFLSKIREYSKYFLNLHIGKRGQKVEEGHYQIHITPAIGGRVKL